MTEAEKLSAAHSLLRRMPPDQLSSTLLSICKMSPDIMESLLPEVDQPLKIRRDEVAKRDFIVCDYNRDGDSFRSPWSNRYFPPAADLCLPSARLREMEERANDAWDGYKDLYYDPSGCTGSVYFWDVDEGFCAAFLVHKVVTGVGQWSSIHCATASDGTSKYSLTSTVLLHTSEEASDGVRLMGSLTQTTEHGYEGSDHVVALGNIIQSIENRMRSSIETIYFGKGKEVIAEVRSVVASAGGKNPQMMLAAELQGRMKKPTA